jgi:chemotaxis protein CheC
MLQFRWEDKSEIPEIEMLLTNVQQDALSELINIGFGRAAGALSILVGQRVIIQAPEIEMYPIEHLEEALMPLVGRDISTVHQVFSGKICGDAMLLMDAESATILVDLLSGGEGVAHALDESDREALGETGNILLNAFIGSFGNLLKVHISFTVPQLRIESLHNMLRTLLIDNEDVEYALIVKVHFVLSEGDVSGYVIIVMGIASMDTLFESMRAVGYLD